MLEAFDRACALVGGRRSMARQLGIRVQSLYRWTRVPAERVLAIETATSGAVTRHELRPDLYPLPAVAA